MLEIRKHNPEERICSCAIWKERIRVKPRDAEGPAIYSLGYRD